VLEQVDGSGSVLARYIQSLDIDEFLAEVQGSTTSYYEADGLGSITSLSSSSGGLTNTYTFNSYGFLTASSGSITNPYQYAGREFDLETGLYSSRARYYDPTIGRFISEDPWGFRSGDGNFYRYVRNGPINLIDPLGLKVTIVIGDRAYSPSGDSIAGTIIVTSDEVPNTFSGFTMENANAGDNGNKPAIPAGTYSAFVRTDHTPNRIELRNVPGYQNIQIHNGSYPRNFKGCFGAGTSHHNDFLGGTINAINQINNIIKADGTGNITVVVGPVR
jgi:RHS repeat-associated protein